MDCRRAVRIGDIPLVPEGIDGTAYRCGKSWLWEVRGGNRAIRSCIAPTPSRMVPRYASQKAILDDLDRGVIRITGQIKNKNLKLYVIDYRREHPWLPYTLMHTGVFAATAWECCDSFLELLVYDAI